MYYLANTQHLGRFFFHHGFRVIYIFIDFYCIIIQQNITTVTIFLFSYREVKNATADTRVKIQKLVDVGLLGFAP